jgi:hypothetical protein
MKRIFIAFDIEHTGETLLAIGMCVGNEKGHVLQKKRINVRVKWPDSESLGDFDNRCWSEFWSKQPQSLITTLQTGAVSLKDAMDALVSWLNELEILYPSRDYKIKFLSDNPSFDIGNLDWYLKTQCGRRALRYSSDGTYRAVENPDDMLDMFPKEQVQRKLDAIRALVVHDHDPSNDAEFIYRQYLAALDLRLAAFNF